MSLDFVNVFILEFLKDQPLELNSESFKEASNLNFRSDISNTNLITSKINMNGKLTYSLFNLLRILIQEVFGFLILSLISALRLVMLWVCTSREIVAN